MVYTTASLLRRITYSIPCRNPDRFWRKRNIFKMSAHFYGRRQNCYRIAVKAVNKALRRATQARVLRKKNIHSISITRLMAACREHGFKFELFKESLIRSNVLLNTKVLADLAIWEPRTFKCLTEFAWKKASEEGLNGINSLGDPPSGVILKPMLIK